MARSSGKVRAARLTDLAALGELSRLAQADGEGTRSLGLPVSGPPVGVFSLFRLPLGYFQPHDVLYVYERDSHIAGLLRVERESSRDEWTVVELDAVGGLDAGEVRYRLVQHLLRDGAKRGAVRFHVACADADDNVELFMQAGFVRYGDECVLYREPSQRLPEPMTDAEAAKARIRPVTPLDAVPLSRLYATATPQPVQRLEGVRLPDWERQGRDWRVPRSSLAPILRFADVEAYVQESKGGGKDGTQLDGFAQVGVAKEDQPHYLKLLALPDADVVPLLRYSLGVIAARADADRVHRQGVLSPVRTYESPLDRRLEEEGFASVATVTLLMKETLVRVAEPRLVPAGVR
ncbi:MAG TPA: hypothetical protein VFL03_09185 [Candidatus Limnocylindrales bacterium]|nr:hypothetical protein [Candidatus Limnocylindrales bacterium]